MINFFLVFFVRLNLQNEFFINMPIFEVYDLENQHFASADNLGFPKQNKNFTFVSL